MGSGDEAIMRSNTIDYRVVGTCSRQVGSDDEAIMRRNTIDYRVVGMCSRQAGSDNEAITVGDNTIKRKCGGSDGEVTTPSTDKYGGSGGEATTPSTVRIHRRNDNTVR